MGVPEQTLSPWIDNQTAFRDTGNIDHRSHMSFTMDEMAALRGAINTLNTTLTGADTVKEAKTYLFGCNKATPVVSQTIFAEKAIAIDIDVRTVTHDVRIKVTLETGSGDVDRYFIVGAEDAFRASFNSDTIKAISMDVLNGSMIDQASGAVVADSAVAVHDTGSFPASTDVVAKITVINA